MVNLIKIRKILIPFWFPAPGLNAPGGITRNASISPEWEDKFSLSGGRTGGAWGGSTVVRKRRAVSGDARKFRIRSWISR